MFVYETLCDFLLAVVYNILLRKASDGTITDLSKLLVQEEQEILKTLNHLQKISLVKKIGKKYFVKKNLKL